MISSSHLDFETAVDAVEKHADLNITFGGARRTAAAKLLRRLLETKEIGSRTQTDGEVLVSRESLEIYLDVDLVVINEPPRSVDKDGSRDSLLGEPGSDHFARFARLPKKKQSAPVGVIFVTVLTIAVMLFVIGLLKGWWSIAL